jgi:hypothetical protein
MRDAKSFNCTRIRRQGGIRRDKATPRTRTSELNEAAGLKSPPRSIGFVTPKKGPLAERGEAATKTLTLS